MDSDWLAFFINHTTVLKVMPNNTGFHAVIVTVCGVDMTVVMS